MDTNALKQTSLRLREKLEFYRHQDPAASLLLTSLEGLMSRAEQHEICTPMEPREIPGYRIFTETNLQKYTDLEAAYTNFYMELTQGRETEIYRIIRERMKKR
jgi:hypothetical protein